jgi:hypothetical protein
LYRTYTQNLRIARASFWLLLLYLTPAKSAAAIKKERMETILSSVKFSKVRSVA